MSHLWFRQPGFRQPGFHESENGWVVMPLNGHAVNISVYPPGVLPEGFHLGEDAKAALIRAELADSNVWVLLIAPDSDVRVNGFPPVAGVRVLQDRDEIRASAGEPLFFSMETQARAEPFPGSDRAVCCARCRQPLEKGQMAVRCPGCGVWYHQTDTLPCWTYTTTCALCPQSTAMDGGFEWVPEV